MSGGLECRACHRPLKKPSPTGYGPVCARRLTGPTRRRSSRPAPVPHASDALPGQDQIPLFFFQASLDGI